MSDAGMSILRDATQLGPVLLIDVAIKSFLLLAAIWAATYLFRKHAAATVHGLWTLGFCGCLIAPLVAVLAPAWTLQVLPNSLLQRAPSDVISSVVGQPAPVAPTASNAGDPLAIPPTSSTWLDQGELDTAEQLAAGADPDFSKSADLAPSGGERTANTQALAASSPPWATACVAAWVFGVLLCLLRTAWHELSLRRMLGQCRNVGDEQWISAAGDAARTLGLHRSVRLQMLEEASSPMIAGIIQITVMLPDDANDWGPAWRRLVLLHELAHAKRHDVLTQAIASVTCALYWFNPLCWYGLIQMRRLRELACDDMVIASGQRPADYADLLLDVARSYRHRKLTTVIGMARGANVEKRILAVLDKARSHVGMSRKAVRSLLVAAVTMVLFIGSVRLQLQADDSTAPSIHDGPASGEAVTRLTGESEVRIAFPRDRSLGMLYMLDARIERKIEDFYYFVDGTGMAWEYLGEATGDVSAPAGKKLALRLNKASGRDLSPLTKLKADDLYQLHLPETSDGQSLSHLASLTGLKVLMFPRALGGKPGPQFTPEDLKQLRPLKSLERLTVPENIGDRELAALVESLPQLRALYFVKNQITDSGLAVLAKLTALEELDIGGDKITGSGLTALSDLPSLHYLSLWGAPNDEALRAVRKISSLKTFKAPESVSDDGLVYLAGHPSLAALSLYNTTVTDRGVAHLASLPSLKKLDLTKRDFDRAHPPITDAATVHLKAVKTLEDLRLPAEGLTDAGLANLAELSNLKALTLPMAHSRDRTRYLKPYTEKGIKELAKLRSLESLVLAGPGVTDAALAQIARLTNLQSLTLFGCPVSDDGLSRLKGLQSLNSFTLMNGAHVTLAGINHLNALTALTKLQADISARGGTRLDISGLTRLESLMLSPDQGSTLRDDDLACLAQLTKLKWLQLGSTQLDITDAGIDYLAGLTSLDRLVLGGPGVTDRSLAVLANLPKLDLLRIGGSFTDEGLEQLENLKGLHSLSIYSANAFSPAATDRFRKASTNLYQFATEQVAARPAATALAHPNPGALAPDFTVTTLDGNQFTLSEHRGKVVMLHFWGTWCEPCVKSLPELEAVHASLKKKYSDRLVLIDLVMDDAASSLRTVVADHELVTPQALIGMRSMIADSYGVVGAPDDFVIGPDGRILLNHESPEGPGDTEAVIDKALHLN